MREFADKIIEQLEAGVKPWVKPWDPNKCAGPQAPFNPTTGDPRGMTYQQAAEKKWQVRKGEKSTTIFFSKPYNVKDEEAEDGERTIRVLKNYSVFHASQVDGIPAYDPPTIEEAPWSRPEAAEIILKNSGAVILVGGGRSQITSSFHRITRFVDRPSLPRQPCVNSPTGVDTGRVSTEKKG